MATVFRPTIPDDEPQLTALMAAAFNVPPTDEMLAPALMRWKFWTPRGDFAEPRSYVMDRNGKVVAHAGIWPMTVHTPAGSFRGCHMVDWAADTKVPGVGAAFLQKFSALFDFVYAIAYSEMARKVLTGFGFTESAENRIGARPIRPVLQARTHQFRGWATPARLARNTWWSLNPAISPASGWSVVEGTSDFEGFDRPVDAMLEGHRSQPFFKYLRMCPAMQVSVFELHHNGRRAGRLALSQVRHQVRLAGLWLTDPTPDNIRTGYALAQVAARRSGSGAELLTHVSTPDGEALAASAGFRFLKRKPILWLSKNPSLPVRPFSFQMSDSDAIWLTDGTNGYLT